MPSTGTRSPTLPTPTVTRRPLVVAFFTDEEGCRFGTDMLGSAVATGRIALDHALQIRDRAGRSVGDELAAIGKIPVENLTQADIDAMLDTYLEQGAEIGVIGDEARKEIQLSLSEDDYDAFTRRGEPFTMARIRWMFGFQRRLVRTWECDTDMPQLGPLPHTSQTAAISKSFVRRRRRPPDTDGKATSPNPSPPTARHHIFGVFPPSGRPFTTLSPVSVIDQMGADDIRRTVVTFRDAMRAHASGINRLNVYPVPDGDTGTNMARTLDAVVEVVFNWPGIGRMMFDAIVFRDFPLAQGMVLFAAAITISSALTMTTSQRRVCRRERVCGPSADSFAIP